MKVKFWVNNSFLFFLLYSCNSIKTDTYYKDCVNTKTKDVIFNGYGIKKDIFTLLKETEILLLNEKIIQDCNKKSYLKLTDIAFHNNELSEKISTKIRNKINDDFFTLLSLSTMDFFYQCPDAVFNKVKSENEKIELTERYTIYTKLSQEGYKNEQRIKDLITITTDFSNSEIQRLVILNVILMNISS